METNYESLNKAVLEYQEQVRTGNKRLQNERFQEIRQRLCHVLNQIMSIILDTDYDGNASVYQIIYEKMTKLTTPANQDKLRVTCRRIVESQNLTEQDVMQQLMIHLIELINSYRPTGDFISYVTYLLPRRITQWLWKQQKSASQQFNTLNIDQSDEYDDALSCDEISESVLHEVLNQQHVDLDKPIYASILKVVLEVRK